jgi:hypothetical protein
MPQPEQLKQKGKYYKSTSTKRKRRSRKTRIKIQKKYSQSKFLPVRRNRIALQYATLKQDTSRYQEEMQTNFKYPAETTANAAKIPRQMSLFIKQDQITSNPRKDYKNNCNARKVAPSYTQKMTLKQIQEESEQNYHIFQLKFNKCTYAK